MPNRGRIRLLTGMREGNWRLSLADQDNDACMRGCPLWIWCRLSTNESFGLTMASLTGRKLGPNESPIFRAQVLPLDLARGKLLNCNAMLDRNGSGLHHPLIDRRRLYVQGSRQCGLASNFASRQFHRVSHCLIMRYCLISCNRHCLVVST